MLLCCKYFFEAPVPFFIFFLLLVGDAFDHNFFSTGSGEPELSVGISSLALTDERRGDLSSARSQETALGIRWARAQTVGPFCLS